MDNDTRQYLLKAADIDSMEGDDYKVAKGDFVGLPANKVAHELFNDRKETLSVFSDGATATA